MLQIHFPLKIKILFGLFVILVLSSFILFEPSEKNNLPPVTSVNGGWDNFYIGAMDMQYESDHSRFDSLGLSIWHRYINSVYSHTLKRYVPTGWTISDSLLADPVTSSYINDVTDKLDEIYNNSSSNNRRKVLLTRPKITWLCYGQSSIYQCEPVPLNDKLWFYSFNNNEVTSQSAIDSGAAVIKCDTDLHSAGFVAKRLKANAEQCQKYHNTAEWEGDAGTRWFIKPRIKIDPSFANDPANVNTNVCRIIVIGQSGTDTLKDINIKASNFLNEGRYNGQYLEEYFNLPFTDSLSIMGAWGDGSLNAFNARGTNNNENAVKADIQVYWYGNCDMWIDYVKVENEIAHRLLKGNDPQFEQWIEAEAKLIGSHPAAFKFYLEYAAFNNVPCLKYVNKRIKEHNNGRVDLMQDMHYRIAEHVPWTNRMDIYNAGFISRYYIDSVGFSQIFTECYPLFSCYNPGGADQTYYSKIPNTLPVHYGENVLAQDVSPALYDLWLQQNMDTANWMGKEVYNTCPAYTCNGTDVSSGLALDWGSMSMQMKLGNEISKLSNVPFIFMPQAHQWYLFGEVRREPTNEELDMMTNLAVSYGVKGLQYFWYHTYYTSSCDYGIGMIEENDILRLNNVYGQGHASGFRYKKEVLQDIHDRLSNKWGPYLMAFSNNVNSYIYRDPYERSEMASGSFLSELRTYSPMELSLNPVDPDFTMLSADSNNSVFVQTAFFTKTDKSPDEHDKYFMIVNRRCSPYINSGSPESLGGRRLVTIKVNTDKFSDFTNWKIYDVESGNLVSSFNRNSNGYVYIGDFMPGQGKLFRVSPVMQ